jgi:two-component system, OmpR family, sensor kinase
VIAFAYILITVIVALGVPLAVNLQRRSESEFRTNLLVQTQTVAAAVGGDAVAAATQAVRRGHGGNTPLQRQIDRLAGQVNGRIIVVNAEGILVADSLGTSSLGRRYETPARPEIVRALGSTPKPNTQVRHSETLGEDLVAAAAPIIEEVDRSAGLARLIGAVRVTQSLAGIQDAVRRTTMGLVALGLAGLAAGLLLAFGISQSLARPLVRLASAARRLGRGDLSVRVDDTGGASEIRDLGHSFDEMADRVENTVQAQRAFVANASHQLRTPLTGMKLRLEAAIDETTDEGVRRQLTAADREVDRLTEIVNRLLSMARRIEAGEVAHTDVHEVAAAAVERWHDRAERAGAALSLSGPRGEAQGNPVDLAQALDNLLENAIRYAPGPIQLTTARRDGRMILAVRDHGPGIPADELEHVTERFYRGRAAPPGGSGLGLAIAAELTQKWGGAFRVSLPSDGGLLVELALPGVETAGEDGSDHQPAADVPVTANGNQTTP